MTKEELALENRKLDIEARKVEIEEAKQEDARKGNYFSLAKWALVSLAAVVSFWLIDIPKLRQDIESRNFEMKRALFDRYVDGTSSEAPYVWQRKLDLIEALLGPEDLLLARFVSKERERLTRAIDEYSKVELLAAKVVSSREEAEKLKDLAVQAHSNDQSSEAEILEKRAAAIEEAAVPEEQALIDSKQSLTNLGFSLELEEHYQYPTNPTFWAHTELPNLRGMAG